MRLRRETGDFQIKINSENAVNTIRKGLSAEDFVGELVNVNGTYEVVNSANDTETGAEFKTNSFTLTYTKATGVITAEEGGSGSGSGSDGSGGGSSDFEIMLTLAPGGGPMDIITDVTFEEIEAAVTACKNIVFSGPDPSDNTKRRAYFPTLTPEPGDGEATAISAIFDIHPTDATTPPTLNVGSILFTKQASASPATVSLSFAEIDINA